MVTYAQAAEPWEKDGLPPLSRLIITILSRRQTAGYRDLSQSTGANSRTLKHHINRLVAHGLVEKQLAVADNGVPLPAVIRLRKTAGHELSFEDEGDYAN